VVGLRRTLPGLTNAHVHGAYGPQYRGVKESRPFELGAINLMAREMRPPTPEEFHACALVTGLENLEAGTTGLIDHYYGPLTAEYVYAVANAYEELGLRAWVLLEFTDLPWLCYTREAYPGFSNAIPEAALAPELRSLIAGQPRAGSADVHSAIALIRGWSGKRVKLGLALGNPTWCTDGLIADVAAAADELGVLLTTHVNESALQRRVSLEQWNLTAVERMQQAGALSARTVVSHAIAISDSDIRLLAAHGTTISYSPISNLKLHGGFAQVGDWIRGDVNVCLGSCGQSSGDAQNLFTVMKFAAALADVNGLRGLDAAPEELVLAMAVENAARLWWEEDRSGDFVEFSEPLGPYAHVWDEPAHFIEEVYIDGIPSLERARELVAGSGAGAIILDLRAQVVAAAQIARADRLTALAAPFLER